MVTLCSLAIIVLVFLWFWYETRKLRKAKRILNKSVKDNDPLESMKRSIFKDISTSYSKTIRIDIEGKLRSNIPSSEFFNDISISKAVGLNMMLLDYASGILVGLGLLGTFVGLTMGVSDFDSSNSENIQKSIQTLLDGMGTAFATSLLGMLLSIIYTIFIEKHLRKIYLRAKFAFTEKLDGLYYIDDVELERINNSKVADELFAKFSSLISEKFEQMFMEFNDKLTYSNEAGQELKVSDAVREILTESEEQSKALKSFSTDLAIEINDRFEETMSRQMQEKILPLMDNVDKTTKTIIEHIDNLSKQMTSPATDMIQTVVNELTSNLSSIIEEFKTGLSGSATSELERLAVQLSSATGALSDFPTTMSQISATMQSTIEQIQLIITSMTNNSEEQSSKIASQLGDAAQKLGAFLDNTVVNLTNSIASTVSNITADVTDKQADLIALQDDTTSMTRNLLEEFNLGLEKLEKMNEYISNTMDMFQKAQVQITGSTGHLQTISENVKATTQTYSQTIRDYGLKMQELQSNTQQALSDIKDLLADSGELSSEYVEKFDVIKSGLSHIFSEIQSGLTEYSNTVCKSTQEYLDKYSTSLTQTTNALSSTIQQQSEVVELLTSSLEQNKAR